MLMTELGKLLITLGGVIIIIGFVLLLAGRFDLPLGRLPGDFSYRGKHTAIYFPLGTSIVLSIILSLILWLLNRGHR
jgi:hypothetical protein